jgi:hypothetical protein
MGFNYKHARLLPPTLTSLDIHLSFSDLPPLPNLTALSVRSYPASKTLPVNDIKFPKLEELNWAAQRSSAAVTRRLATLRSIDAKTIRSALYLTKLQTDFSTIVCLGIGSPDLHLLQLFKSLRKLQILVGRFSTRICVTGFTVESLEIDSPWDYTICGSTPTVKFLMFTNAAISLRTHFPNLENFVPCFRPFLKFI